MNKIGFIDSGIGGLTILKDVINTFSNESYIYLADNLNNPYGSKSKDELLEISKKNISYLISMNCNIIVLACGTISSNIYDELCLLYPNIIFIRVLTNLDKYSSFNTLFMATKRTCESPYIKTIASSKFVILPCNLLAPLIEEDNNDKIDNYLYELLNKYKDINFDYLILGCTHYPLVIDIIKKYLNYKEVITLSNDVIIELNNILANNNSFNLKIYNTLEDKNYNRRCYEILDM